MSFGYSVGDIVALVQLAHKTYRNCQKAGDEYVEIARETRSLHSVLKILHTESLSSKSVVFKQDRASVAELLLTISGCQTVLSEIDDTLTKYKGLNPDNGAASTAAGKKLWHKIHFGSKVEELGVIRGKLIAYTSTLSVLLDTMQLKATGQLGTMMETGFADLKGDFEAMRNEVLATIIRERSRHRRGSLQSLSSLSTYDDDNKETWISFRRELIGKGFRSQILDMHRDVLVAYIMKLEKSGLLETEPATESSMASFEHIRTKNPRAADILSLMAFLDPQDIPSSLVVLENEDPVAFIDAIRDLEVHSLIMTNEQGSSYNIHRLVQLATRTWLTEHGNAGRWASQALSILAARFPSAEYETWRLCAAYLPHAEATLDCNLEDCSEINVLARATLLCKTSVYLNTQGSFEAARTKAKESVELREKLLGHEHPDTMASLSNLAAVLQSEGEYQAAEEINRRVVEIQGKVLGNDHPDTLTSVDNLGFVLWKSCNFEAAEEMIRRALEGRKTVLGEEHLDTLTSIDHLSAVLERQGEFESAEMMAQQALKGRERILGEEHPDTLISVDNLVWALMKQNKAEVFEVMSQRALNGREKLLGKEHPDTLNSIYSRAVGLAEQEKYREAEKMHRQALRGREKVLRKEHPNTLYSVHGLAWTLAKQRKYKAAEDMYWRAIKGREKTLGEEHVDTLRSVFNLAGALGGQGKYKEAEKMDRRALKVREKILGEEHVDTLKSFHGLAWTLGKQRKYKEAEELYWRALRGKETILGEEHLETLKSAHGLAWILGQQGIYKEAEKMYWRALKGREKILGEKHLDTLESVQGLAWVLRERGGNSRNNFFTMLKSVS
jgi:tetratricopeptide (TPR) repeat protein